MAGVLAGSRSACADAGDGGVMKPQDRFTDARHAKAFRDLNQAVALERTGLLAEAESAYAKVIESNPQYFDALHLYGLFKFKRGQLSDAIRLVAKAHKLNPGSLNALNSLGVMYAHLKNYEQALDAFNKIIRHNENDVLALSNKAQCLNELGRFQETVDVCNKILSLDKFKLDAYLARGAALLELKDHEQALSNYQKIVGFNQTHGLGWCGTGNALYRLKRYDEALAAYDRALSIKSDLENAWLGRGNAFCDLKRHDEALAAYDKALSIKSDLENAWLGRGNVFYDLKRHDEALAAYDKALSIKSDLENAWLGRGNVFCDLKRHDEALAAYDKALRLDPDLEYAEGLRLHTKMHLCDWTNIEGDISQLLSNLRNQKPLIPFVLLSIPSSPMEQLQCAKGFIARQRSFPAPLWRGEIYSHDRIRIAYLSSDFNEHALASLIAGLFEVHDKARCQVFALSSGPSQNSPMRQRIAGAVEHFIDVRDKSDQQIAELIRRLEIDIAIDLNGLTSGGRSNVFARRAAPLQVNYLGYTATMGADFIDYIIADPTIIPQEQFASYAERVVWLPDTYQVNWKRRISEQGRTRRECDLPDEAFVYCCFNNPYKILPDIFDIWMRLLRAQQTSVLWMLDAHPTTCANLRQEAEKRGVSANRLVFAPRAPLPEHLARHQHADLFLDTLPYNAHTTASDALWSGLPVLTQIGQTFAGRVAASLLNAIGLPELITHSRHEYESLAVELTLNREKLSNIKEKLNKNRLTMPLFNTALFARYIEAAYAAMYQRHQAGLPPDHIEIQPITTSG